MSTTPPSRSGPDASLWSCTSNAGHALVSHDGVLVGADDGAAEVGAALVGPVGEVVGAVGVQQCR